MNSEKEDLELIGFSTKEALLNYAEIMEITIDKDDNVRSIYEKVSGHTFETLLNEIERDTHTMNNTMLKANTKIVSFDFSHPELKTLEKNSYFYMNIDGFISPKPSKIEKHIYLSILSIISIDSANKLLYQPIQSFSDWVSVEFNNFHIKKLKDNGVFLITFQEINVPFVPKALPEKEDDSKVVPKPKSEKVVDDSKPKSEKVVNDSKPKSEKVVNDSKPKPKQVVNDPNVLKKLML